MPMRRPTARSGTCHRVAWMAAAAFLQLRSTVRIHVSTPAIACPGPAPADRPGACRLRAERAEGAAGTAPAPGHRCDAAQEGGCRPRRVCRPLRGRRVGRGPRPRVGLSRGHPFPGRPARATGRPPVHDRSPAVPDPPSRRRAPTSPRPEPISPSPRATWRAQNVRVGTVITQQTFDQRAQAKRVAEASVAAQEAAVRQAALDLEFTELRAPVSGRIGDRRVSPGNLVTGGTSGSTTLLATIQSTDPIRFEFTFDEAAYLRYAAAGPRCRRPPTRGLTVPVKLKLIDEAEFTHAAAWTSSTTSSTARRARSAGVPSSPIPKAPCYAGHVRAGPGGGSARRARRCWCRMPPSAPSRRASSCWWSMTRTSPARST